jgi:hypothetical protein
MGVPVSLSINVSQDFGRETALDVPTWMTFLMMGVSFSPTNFIRKLY